MTSIRRATPADIPAILYFIRALALYEREPDAVEAAEEDLLRDGFGARFLSEWRIMRLTGEALQSAASWPTAGEQRS